MTGLDGSASKSRWRRFSPEVSAQTLVNLTSFASLASVLAIVATLLKFAAWRLDLHYVEPWYGGEPPEKHHLYYDSFIDRQLLWIGLPLIATNLMTLAVLWLSLRSRNRSAPTR